MRIPKKYGESKLEKCPFCQEFSTTRNPQKIPVCKKHQDSNLESIKCLCGSTLLPMQGKFGTFFNCMNCGNMSLTKALSMRN